MRTTAANGLREPDVPSGDLVCFTSLLLVRSRAVVQKSRCYITYVSLLLLIKWSFFDFASQRSGSLLIASVTVLGRLLGSTQLYTKQTELQWQSSPGASLRLIQPHKAIHQAKWLKRSSQATAESYSSTSGIGGEGVAAPAGSEIRWSRDRVRHNNTRKKNSTAASSKRLSQIRQREDG